MECSRFSLSEMMAESPVKLFFSSLYIFSIALSFISNLLILIFLSSSVSKNVAWCCLLSQPA